MRAPRLGWPASYRGRIALVMAILVATTLVVQLGIRSVVESRVQSVAQRNLQDQATALAQAVDAAPTETMKRERASDAARYLTDTRILVTWPSPGGTYYNLVSLDRVYVSATARSGGVEARLQRGSPTGGLSDWLLVGLFLVGIAIACALVWSLATALSRRLRRQAASLAASADAVSGGDLTVRADVTEDELGRVAAAFNAMTVRLAAADERQRRFLADIAHELRTPVTAIDGFASALADGTASTPAAREEALGFIAAESARLRELIGELRELTWLDLDPPLRVERFDLAETARESVARFAAAASDAGVELHAPEGSFAVRTDRGHVETILANLLTNAIAATPAGGSVTVAVDRAPEWVAIAVADTGVGIAADDQKRIFDRLYRVDASRVREGGGSGLGLAIVKRLAEALGGSVAVASAPGRGATFTVRLPAAVAEPPAQRPRLALPGRRTAKPGAR